MLSAPLESATGSAKAASASLECQHPARSSRSRYAKSGPSPRPEQPTWVVWTLYSLLAKAERLPYAATPCYCQRHKNTSRLAQVEAETGTGLPEVVKEEFMEHARNWHLNLWRNQL